MMRCLVNSLCCFAVAVLALSAVGARSEGAGTAGAEKIVFPGLEVELGAMLLRPEGAGPFPAVVALHGCGGLYGRDGALSPRHADWAGRLTAAGFIVLFVDSFGSRGAQSQCRTGDRVARAWKERVDDAVAARFYLSLRADVKSDAISLLGWSNGATTVLYTLRRLAREGTKASFAAAVAFYPGCRLPVERGDWHTATPLLLMIGGADDWTPAAPCEALVNSARTAGEPANLIVYPGAYHDFDHPDQPVRRHSGLAYTADGSGSAHSGTDPVARADALVRVPAFLPK